MRGLVDPQAALAGMLFEKADEKFARSCEIHLQSLTKHGGRFEMLDLHGRVSL